MKMRTRILVVAVLGTVLSLGVASQAVAATDNIVINAQVNSKITVTTGADHDFGAFDPDAANPAPYAAPVNVRSNVAYTFARSVTSDFPVGMLSLNTPVAMDGVTVNPKAPSAAGVNWPQTYTLDLRPAGDWVDPGSYSADILYTALP
ncbi:MAG TPA: hypothetical protein VLA05_11075 [Coriobacteriia bacterium]|nr:hypothetical protein [Coriobacteriia bacterium]